MIRYNPNTDLDYRRAALLLRKRINNVNDLQALWRFSGPCMEKHPLIEKIIDDRKKT
jgi:hypothetical protein